MSIALPASAAGVCPLVARLCRRQFDIRLRIHLKSGRSQPPEDSPPCSSRDFPLLRRTLSCIVAGNPPMNRPQPPLHLKICPQVLVILYGLGRYAAHSPSLSRPPQKHMSNPASPGQAVAQRVPLRCDRVPHFARPCGCGLDPRRVLLVPESAVGKGCCRRILPDCL